MSRTPPDVELLLNVVLGMEATAIGPIGAGHWAMAYRFDSMGGRYVIRLAENLDDFEKDRTAGAYRSGRLPVPRVSAIGRFRDLHYAISTRAEGMPLERASREQWVEVLPALVGMLGAMEAATPVGDGWGGWNGDGVGAHASWRDHLLSVAYDEPTERTFGWSDALQRYPVADNAFTRGLSLLDDVAQSDVPRALIHGDLLHRNVHVDGAKVTGVFDWGCGAYGDPLYDLAWFEFWAPWHPDLDTAALIDAVTFSHPDRAVLADRRFACLLHIGLDHLAYHAHRGNEEQLTAVAGRLARLMAAHGF